MADRRRRDAFGGDRIDEREGDVLEFGTGDFPRDDAGLRCGRTGLQGKEEGEKEPGTAAEQIPVPGLQ
ncbi:hypothetical protein [Thauera sp. SDU_THAU2]|uniref:hypothetical protein n=1 Tax=Thauera sp. SDU_THAU2 TaxID=3136633 RepID=UPI00311F8A2C